MRRFRNQLQIFLQEKLVAPNPYKFNYLFLPLFFGIFKLEIMKRKYQSKILRAIHEDMKEFHEEV